jgi:predicted MFS family arabinose efflux permease
MSERRLLFLLGAVQFVNIVDFMMVVPLGPDFASALGIATDHLGLVAGCYTAAAAVAGMVGALFLDRFDRRKALLVALLGLFTGTAAGGFATDIRSMLLARVVAGAFGGPATALALSILTDAVPPERRGRALGAVMGAFSAASVLGVPAGLTLARLGGWRMPFFAIAGLGLAVAVAVASVMPPMRAHLGAGYHPAARRQSLVAFLADRTVLLSLSATAVAMTGAFAVIVNISPFVQFNLGYPRSGLEILYMAGGAVSFFTMRWAGRLVDRQGSVKVATVGTALVALVIGLAFVPERSLIPVVVMFVGFMIANSTRVVALNTLTSRVPAPQERARFMSAQSAVQHLATSTGAIVSSWVLRERPDRSLAGMPALALGAIVLSAVLPLPMAAVAARLRARDGAAARPPSRDGGGGAPPSHHPAPASA